MQHSSIVERSRQQVAGSARRVVATALRQPPGQVDFATRRFRLRAGTSRHTLEMAAVSFLDGFNSAISVGCLDDLEERIGRLEPALRGFAYEGAGMASGILDLLTGSGGRRLRALLAGPARRYPHLVHVGAGWAYARLHLRPWWGLRAGEPLLRWLAWDGYGFHQGFFHADRVVGRRRVEGGLTPVQRSIRDQGLGRALWFHECADVDGIRLRIEQFAPARRADLWSGVGLAAAYAGAAEQPDLERLVAYAGEHRADLAQGSAFACAAWHISGTHPPHTLSAAPVLTGVDLVTAAEWTAQACASLGTDPGSAQDYQCWRAGIRRLWARSQGGWAS
jgi:hypothetical protein